MRVGSLEGVHSVVEVEVVAIEEHVMVVVAGIEEEIEKESETETETETESRKNGATAGIESDTVQPHPNRCRHRCR